MRSVSDVLANSKAITSLFSATTPSCGADVSLQRSGSGKSDARFEHVLQKFQPPVKANGEAESRVAEKHTEVAKDSHPKKSEKQGISKESKEVVGGRPKPARKTRDPEAKEASEAAVVDEPTEPSATTEDVVVTEASDPEVSVAEKTDIPADGASPDVQTQSIVVSEQTLVVVVEDPKTLPLATEETTPTEPEVAVDTQVAKAQLPAPPPAGEEPEPEAPAKPVIDKNAFHDHQAKHVVKPADTQQQAQNQPQNENQQDASAEQKRPAFHFPMHKPATKQSSNEADHSGAAPMTPDLQAPTMPLQSQIATRPSIEPAVAMTPNSPAPQQTESKPAITGAWILTETSGAAPARGADSAEAARPAQQLPQSEQDQVFDQVVLGLRGKLDAKNGKAEIRLDPPNLGTLHVSVSLKNGALTAEFQSASDLVRDLLKSNMEKLKSVLEGNGVAVDKLAVEAPNDKGNLPQAVTKSANPTATANNDGRSAGQYHRDSSGQKKSPGTFGNFWREGFKTGNFQDAPIDVVA